MAGGVQARKEATALPARKEVRTICIPCLLSFAIIGSAIAPDSIRKPTK
jgi:hypothetical protein